MHFSDARSSINVLLLDICASFEYDISVHLFFSEKLIHYMSLISFAVFYISSKAYKQSSHPRFDIIYFSHLLDRQPYATSHSARYFDYVFQTSGARSHLLFKRRSATRPNYCKPPGIPHGMGLWLNGFWSLSLQLLLHPLAPSNSSRRACKSFYLGIWRS